MAAKHFEVRVVREVSDGTTLVFTPRSPDLNSLDFFLVGQSKWQRVPESPTVTSLSEAEEMGRAANNGNT